MDQAEQAVTEEPEIDEELEQEEAEPEEIESDEPEEDDSEEETEESDSVEVELSDGRKVSVPKELNDRMLMQADYTRKTQSLSEQRQAQAERETKYNEVVERQSANWQLHTQLATLDKSLEDYKDLDWVAVTQQLGEDAAAMHQRNYRALQQQRQEVVTNLEKADQDVKAKQAEFTQANLQQTMHGLKDAIADYSPSVGKQLAEHAMKNLNFPAETLKEINDGGIPANVVVPFMKAVHDSMQLAELMTKRGKVTRKVMPGPKVTPKGAKSGKPSIYSKNLTPEQRIKMFKNRKK